MTVSRTEIQQLKKAATSKPSLRPIIKEALQKLKASDQTLEAAAEEERFEHRYRQAGWSMNFAKVPVDKARAYAGEQLNQAGLSVDEAFPNFDENYQLVAKRTQNALDIPRHKMPVIEPEQIDKFMDDLQEGHVDIFRPWAEGELITPEDFGSKEEADEWITLGVQDGKEGDDVVRAKLTSMSAGKLKPTQGQIWFDKIIKNTIEFGVVDGGSPLLDMTIIVSKDGYLLDGHHRWSNVALADPSLNMSVLHVPLDIQLLLNISRSYGFALGNEPKH